MHSKQKGTFPTTPRILAAFLMAFFLMVSCGCSTKIGQPVLPDSEGNGSETETPDDNKPDENKPDENKPGENEQTPDSEGYVLMWSDEFDSNSLDTGKWRIEVNGNGGGNAELQYYDESGISLGKDSEYGNSALKITAKREQRNGKAFVSGRLNTSGHFQFCYGKVEGRIRLPRTANGLWPAFWLLGADFQTNSWPRCGEIDIMEMGNAEGIKNGTQDRFFNGACHWGYYKGSAYPNYAHSTTNSYSIQDGNYHTYTLIWTPQSVKMYLDRDLHPNASTYYEMDIVNKDDDWGVGYYFHHDFFIILNLAVGGYFTGILQPEGITALPNNGDSATMFVDWVRVYQKKQ